MNSQRASGIVLLAGVAFLWLGAFVAPSGVYQEPAIEDRLTIIENNQTAWISSKVLDALAVVVPSAGFVLLTVHLRQSRSRFPAMLGTVAFAVAAPAGAVYVYFLAMDPASIWQNSFLAGPGLLAVAFTASLAAGLGLYGIVFRRWIFRRLGPVMVSAAAIALGALVVFVGSSPFFVVAFLYFVVLAVGIRLVKTAGPSP